MACSRAGTCSRHCLGEFPNTRSTHRWTASPTSLWPTSMLALSRDWLGFTWRRARVAGTVPRNPKPATHCDPAGLAGDVDIRFLQSERLSDASRDWAEP